MHWATIVHLYPTTQNVLDLLTQIRVGGMIAGKIGVLHIHLGNVRGAFEMFEEIVNRGFPIRHIRPTHCARDKYVFGKALEFAKRGGRIDITTGGSCCFESPADAVEAAWDAGIEPSIMTMSSDGHGSVPRFNEKGEMVGLGVGGVACNLRDLKKLIARGHAVEKRSSAAYPQRSPRPGNERQRRSFRWKQRGPVPLR